MKNEKMHKTIKTTALCAAIILLSILGIFSVFIIGEKQMKKQIVEIGEQKGYDITFENNQEFYVTEHNTKYYYKNGLGKVQLKKIYTEVPSKADYKVVDNKGKITITVQGKDKFEVAMEDDIIEVNPQGIESIFHEHIYFVCSSKFTMESIDSDNIATVRGKADKYYNKITEHFISGDELRERYERGIAIVEELMKH